MVEEHCSVAPTETCGLLEPKNLFGGVFFSSKKLRSQFCKYHYHYIINVFEFNIVSYRAIRMNNLYILNVNRFYYASVYQLVILLLTIRFGFQVCLVFFKYCTDLCAHCVYYVLRLLLLLLSAYSSFLLQGLFCIIPPTTYMNKLFCVQTPFAFHASQFLLVSEVNQPRDGFNSQPKSDISAV